MLVLAVVVASAGVVMDEGVVLLLVDTGVWIGVVEAVAVVVSLVVVGVVEVVDVMLVVEVVVVGSLSASSLLSVLLLSLLF